MYPQILEPMSCSLHALSCTDPNGVRVPPGHQLTRYRGQDSAEPLPQALAETVRRNALAAQKRIQKTQRRREDAKGAWPSCRGVPLGSRDTQCSTEDL